jgi:hypothetical protein
VKGFGLVGRARAPRWDPSLYDNAPGKRLTVKLYKLHGSLDWRRNGDVVEEVGADEYVKGRNALICPIRKPVIEEPFTNLFERFKQRLQESGVCVVIGSSLRDEYIPALVEQLKPKHCESSLSTQTRTSWPRFSERTLALSGLTGSADSSTR